MKKILVLLLVIFSYNSNAQFSVNKWYFGYNAGLNFNSGEPEVLTDSRIYQWEGNATICDADGELLLYSDGVNVWNKFHSKIADDLLGGNSSTQSAIFVPNPADDNQMYIFTTDEIESINNEGLRYSLIDYKFNNYDGRVVEKNEQLLTPATEKVTAVKIPFENAYWVISHAWEMSEFVVYKVDESGVNLFNTFPTNMYDDFDRSNDPNRAAGYLKFNMKSGKLVAAAEGKGLYIYDFDIFTGEISNEMSFVGGDLKYSYGVEFSQSGKKLYVSTIEPSFNSYDINEVFQLDLSNDNQDAISKSIINLIDREMRGAGIQMAPDGKIYLSKGNNYLDVINSPEGTGLLCDITFDAILLGDTKTRAHFGFPNFIQEFLPSNIKISGTNEICEDETITITANEIQNAIYNWSGPNNFSSDKRIIEISNANRNNSGYYYCEVNVNNNYKLLDSFFVQVNFTDFELSRKTVIFPEICLGNSTFYEIYLKNTGNTAIGISRANFDDDAFSFSAFDKMILPNDSLKISLNYDSYKSGEFENIFDLEIQSICGTKDISIPLFTSVSPRNISLNIPDISGVPGAKVCFDITASSTCVSDEKGFQFTLSFDPRTFYITEISNGRIDNLEYQNESLVLVEIILDEVNLTDTMSILTTICGEIMLDKMKSSVFTITDINSLTSGEYQVHSGTLNIGDICAEEWRYIKLFDLAFISVLIQGESVGITVNGEEVGKFKLEVFNSSLSSVLLREWNSDGEFIQTFTLDKLASGTYFIILTTPSGYEIKEKFVFIK